MAAWLKLDDPFELLARAIAPPWGNEPLEEAPLKPASWRRVECEWATHDVLDCPRDAATAICIHRLTLPASLSEPLNSDLLAVSTRAFEDDSGAGRQRDADAASNIGGFHSSRDLCDWPSVQEAGLGEMLGRAARACAKAEAERGGREPLPLPARLHEAWLNVLPARGYNTLHTHPGCTYSGVYYVAGGEGAGAPDGIGGRLALLVSAPTTLSADANAAHVLPRGPSGGEGEMAAPVPRGGLFAYLLLDPTPGTCVCFPSFVPHFVVPNDAAAGRREDGPLGPRVSVAFNVSERPGV